MRVAIFGLGYVGTVCAACLARFGHEVVGVDLNEDKNAQISAGRSPIVEPGLEELIAESVEAKRLSATSDHERAVADSELSLVCVGTPSRANGSLDTSHVEHVAQTIGEALRGKDSRHTVVVRSTLLPGSTLGLVRPTLEEASGKRCGEEIGLAYNPEFLREGSAVADFRDPPYTLVGESRRGQRSGGRAALREPRRAAASGHDPRGRDGQVRGQRVPRGQDRLRQRNRRLQPRGRASTGAG